MPVSLGLAALQLYLNLNFEKDFSVSLRLGGVS